MNPGEAFAVPESRVYRVVMFVDMTGSTAMKEQEPEAHWLTTLGHFFGLVGRQVGPERITKYLGDGVLAVYEDGDAAEAINAAIRIQEELAKDNQDRIVDCFCSIGIAAGEVIRYQDPRGQDHYIGIVVDRAARLCSHASPKSILVDKATVDTAAMNRVKAVMGEWPPRRTVDDYLGEPQTASLKGFQALVKYYEIWWDRTRYGVASSNSALDHLRGRQLRESQVRETPGLARR